MLNTNRKSNYSITPYILNRYSGRKLSGAKISKQDLMPLFEAARWAPSAMNNQLWHFAYAHRETEIWDKFFDLVAEGNKEWVKNAGVLVILLSRKEAFYKNKPQASHSLEAGMALQNLAIEASTADLITHPFAGFDFNSARRLLNLPDVWNIECMIAIGKLDTSKEEEITDRKPLQEIITEGIPNLK